MAEAALGVWISTALIGLYLIGFTSGIGRPEGVARLSRLPPLVLFVHPATTSTGLAVWIVVVVTRSQTLAWVGVAILVLGIVLGDVLLVRTVRHTAPTHGAVPLERDPEHTVEENLLANRTTAESLMPKPAIALHGGLALLTLGLTIGAAATMGGSL